jgi:hypothetical protein
VTAPGQVGEVYETCVYEGHVYVIVRATDEDVTFAILANHELIPEATPGKEFRFSRDDLTFGIESGQMVRIA